VSPNDLLPRDQGAGEWAQLNPSGNGSLNNINTLKAGSIIGLSSSVSSVFKNGNLQLRSEVSTTLCYVIITFLTLVFMGVANRAICTGIHLEQLDNFARLSQAVLRDRSG
jgi:hypothetical protein